MIWLSSLPPFLGEKIYRPKAFDFWCLSTLAFCQLICSASTPLSSYRSPNAYLQTPFGSRSKNWIVKHCCPSQPQRAHQRCPNLMSYAEMKSRPPQQRHACPTVMSFAEMKDHPPQQRHACPTVMSFAEMKDHPPQQHQACPTVMLYSATLMHHHLRCQSPTVMSYSNL